MSEIQSLLRTVERLNGALAVAVLAAGFAWLGWGFGWVSLLLGTSLGAVNFRAMGWVAKRITHGSDASKAGYTLLFVAKLVVLMAACYVLVVLVKVEVLPFLAGISTVPVALLAGSWWHMHSREAVALPPSAG